MDYSQTGSSVHGLLQARILKYVAMPSSRDGTQVSHIAGGFFTIWATREAIKNTGVGSLPLLQGIFLTQESNQGLLHYGQILYQLSYQGSPNYAVGVS